MLVLSSCKTKDKEPKIKPKNEAIGSTKNQETIPDSCIAISYQSKHDDTKVQVIASANLPKLVFWHQKHYDSLSLNLQFHQCQSDSQLYYMHEKKMYNTNVFYIDKKTFYIHLLSDANGRYLLGCKKTKKGLVYYYMHNYTGFFLLPNNQIAARIDRGENTGEVEIYKDTGRKFLLQKKIAIPDNIDINSNIKYYYEFLLKNAK